MELLAGISLAAIEQWGYYVESQNPTDYRYWSIPFTSHYITMATKTYYEPKEEAVPWLVGIDMQKFICGYGANFIGSSYVSCVGIGCQPQWGKTISGNNVKTKFPIAFTAFCMLSVSVNSSNGNAAESVFRNGFGYTNKTLSDWILRGPTGDATYFADYIAIGCQPQWGYGNSESTQTFPIKFTNSVIGIYGSKRAINYEYTFAATSITNTNFFMSTRNSEGNSRVIACNWLAIGQQQTK